jgi:large subunit ribosomal protein L15
MAINMEAAKDIVSRPMNPGAKQVDEYDRQPFEHEQLASVDNLSVHDTKDVAGKEKLYNLAQNVGLLSVMRWKPRLVCLNLCC